MLSIDGLFAISIVVTGIFHFLRRYWTLVNNRNVNSSIILHTVDDILRQLEIKREKFSLFLTDAAR